ncbi:DUF1372 family protein [Streptococcus hyointestinalis]|nr:DUF1372 family protein [Streptococcus hyointestinalis]
MKKILTSRLTLAIMLLVMSILNLVSVGEKIHLRHQLKTQQTKIIIHEVDNAGASIVGKVTDKEIIEGRYTLTVGAYGKFLVTKEQYESVAVGDDVPDYLKNGGQ